MRPLVYLIATVLLVLVSRFSAIAGDPQYLAVSMRSDALSAFWGQPITIDAHILLPDSYYKEPKLRYPVLYWIQGFDQYGDPDFSRNARMGKANAGLTQRVHFGIPRWDVQRRPPRIRRFRQQWALGQRAYNGVYPQHGNLLSSRKLSFGSICGRPFVGRVMRALASGYVS